MDGSNLMRKVMKVVLIIIAVIALFFVFAYILGSSADASAKYISPSSFCKKYKSHPACTDRGKIGYVETINVVKSVSADRRPNCYTIAKRRKYSSNLGPLLFWTQIDQVMCPDSKRRRIAQVLPAVATSRVTTTGLIAGFKISDPRVTGGFMPWRGYARGSYRSDAVFQVVQEPCVPIVNFCARMRQFDFRQWIRGFADGSSAWGS